MKIPVLVDAEKRIVAAADVGFHLGTNELEAEFADELVQDGHVAIYDDRMIALYCLLDGVAVPRSPEEIDADYAARPAPSPTDEERIAALEERNAHLEEALSLLLSGATEEVNDDG